MNGRPDHMKGAHDDAIMALCLALYARESQQRGGPIGLGGIEDDKYTEAYKAEIYDEIKRELAKDSPHDWMDPDDADLLSGINRDELSPAIIYGIKRQNDGLLREFGW